MAGREGSRRAVSRRFARRDDRLIARNSLSKPEQLRAGRPAAGFASGERRIRVVGRISRLRAPGDKNGDQIFRGVYLCKALYLVVDERARPRIRRANDDELTRSLKVGPTA